MRWTIVAILCVGCASGGDPDVTETGQHADAGVDSSLDAQNDGASTCDPSADPCPPSQHCSELLHECIDGCRSDDGCDGRKCDVANHECVGCVSGSDCTAGEVCSAGNCVPSCSGTNPCPGAFTCCTPACVDMQSNVDNCGKCGNACSVANGKAVCTAGACAVGKCDPPFADCDGKAGNGCETNTSSDVANCGGCGKACAPAHATGKCVVGGCVVDACNGGFANCDGKQDNGCEADLAHDPSNCGACGSAPGEVCNLRDDNCNGACDENDGCRVAVSRSVSSKEHFYTTDATEAGCCGYTVENSPYFWLYSSSQPDTTAFYRCYDASLGRHFYTTSSTCEVWGASALEGTMGFIGTKEVCGATALYRLTKNNDHLFTIDAAEKAGAISGGWIDEGVAGWVWTASHG